MHCKPFTHNYAACSGNPNVSPYTGMVGVETEVWKASETELLIHFMMDAQMFSSLREDRGGGKNKRDNSISCQQLSPGTAKAIRYYQGSGRDNAFGSFAPHTGNGGLRMLTKMRKSHIISATETEGVQSNNYRRAGIQYWCVVFSISRYIWDLSLLNMK